MKQEKSIFVYFMLPKHANNEECVPIETLQFPEKPSVQFPGSHKVVLQRLVFFGCPKTTKNNSENW